MLFEEFGDALGFIKPRLGMAIPGRSATLFRLLSLNFPQFRSVGNKKVDSVSCDCLW